MFVLKPKVKEINTPDFIDKHEIKPTPPGDALDWKMAYLDQAKALWIHQKINQKTGPESVTQKLYDYRDSKKLFGDKGKGKF